MELQKINMSLFSGILLTYGTIDPEKFVEEQKYVSNATTHDLVSTISGSTQTFEKMDETYGPQNVASIAQKLKGKTLVDIGGGQKLNYPLINFANQVGLKRLITIDYHSPLFDKQEADAHLGDLEFIMLKGNFFDFLPTLSPNYNFTAGQLDHNIVSMEKEVKDNNVYFQDLINKATEPGGIYFGHQSWHMDLVEKHDWKKHDVSARFLYFFLEKQE